MKMWMLALVLLFVPATVQAAGFTFGPRLAITHPGKGHELELSGAAIASGQHGEVFVTWARPDGQTNNLYLARLDKDGSRIVRVNPEGMSVDSLHQSPGMAMGPKGEIYISWSSTKPKPEGTLFASDLRLSRSLDSGQSFDSHIRVNEDRPISHSFEGLAVAADGVVFVSWIDSREGWEKASTYLARIGEQGAQIEHTVTLDGNTCVCCRSHVATGPQNSVAALWRKVFPGDIRDMELGLSKDGGRSFRAPIRVHQDHWQLNACPHRGGSLAIDKQEQLYTTWYTEGAQDRPNILFARSTEGRHFTSLQRLDVSVGSIPDHVRMAVDAAGRIIIVWEDATAVRRQVVSRYSIDGGRTFSPLQVLSQALKAYAPDITVSPTGDFFVAWHEEQFPQVKTIVQTVRLDHRQ